MFKWPDNQKSDCHASADITKPLTEQSSDASKQQNVRELETGNTVIEGEKIIYIIENE